MPQLRSSRPLLFASLALMSAACEPWVPDSFPVVVDLSENLTSEQKQAARSACESWNAAVQEPVLSPVEGNGRRIQRGRIHVKPGNPRPGALATAETDHWHCEIEVRGLGNDPATLVHELGHCLGLSHDKLPFSIMAAYAGAEQRLLPEHVAHVRALMLDFGTYNPPEF